MTEQKTQEQMILEKQEKAQLVAKIMTMTNKVPAGHNLWSYYKAVEFKDAVRKARAYANGVRINLIKLREQYANVARFF